MLRGRRVTIQLFPVDCEELTTASGGGNLDLDRVL